MNWCNLHTELRLPTGIFYAQGVKTNVLFFTRATEEAPLHDATEAVWIYDMRSGVTEPVKRRIVEHLACYHSPTVVTRLIKEEFGITLTARHVRAHDPTSPQCTAAHRWADYHQATRERFRNEAALIAITHRAFRLHRLQQAFDDAFDRGNFRLAAKLMEQAAKEMGNWFVR